MAPSVSIRKLATRIRQLPSSVPEPEQSETSPILDNDSRWKACFLLHQAGTPYKVWTEQDVFQSYGLRRFREQSCGPYGFQSVDLGLLVNDLEEAAAILEGAGYFKTDTRSPEQERMGYSPDDPRKIRLLNVSAMVKEYGRWESFENVVQKVSNAAGVEDSGIRGFGNSSIMRDIIKNREQPGNGVLLMLASDWNYDLPAALGTFHEPIPRLSEYFDSHISMWMNTPIGPFTEKVSSADLKKLSYNASTLGVLISEADAVWTCEFENSIKKKHRQVLFDLMDMDHKWIAKKGPSVSSQLTTDADFQTYAKTVSYMIKTGVHEPVPSLGVCRNRVRGSITVPLPRGQATKADEKHYSMGLPRLSWLVRVPRGDGWVLLSLNIPRILGNRKKESNPVEPDWSFTGMEHPERSPEQYWMLEYHLRDILADTKNWAYQ